MADPDVLELVEELIGDCPELADYAAHRPEIAAVQVIYDDGNAFDSACRKKVGGRPVRIVQVDHAIRCITSKKGLAKKGPGLDFLVKLDPAVWEPLPLAAKRAYLFDALVGWSVEYEVDKESGEKAAKEDGDGHVRWYSKGTANHPETFARFGPWNQYTQAILDAIGKRAKEDLPLFDWRPELPEHDAGEEEETPPEPRLRRVVGV